MLLLTVALVGGAGVVAVQVLKPMVAGLTESKDWTGTGTGRATVVVHAGDSGRTIGVALQEAGVVKTSKAFADVAADNPQAGSIQPGSYALRKHMSASAALDMLLDPVNRTVPTGSPCARGCGRARSSRRCPTAPGARSRSTRPR